ncbi:MAG: hypothetical protein L0338_12865, partial [Acidobacteria bacterium]|nr:hypothetical protein [Acidobacteriota bacterium]
MLVDDFVENWFARHLQFQWQNVLRTRSNGPLVVWSLGLLGAFDCFSDRVVWLSFVVVFSITICSDFLGDTTQGTIQTWMDGAGAALVVVA